MRKKLVILMICFVLVILVNFDVSSVSISKILIDNVEAENGTVIHILNSYMDIENVTIMDYFDEVVKVKDYNLKKEEFLGQTKYALRIYVGDMLEGETKILSYNITKAKTDAKLGADTYYLEGELHQLSPKEVSVDIRSRQKYFYIYAIMMIAAISTAILIVVMHLNHRGRKK